MIDALLDSRARAAASSVLLCVSCGQLCTALEITAAQECERVFNGSLRALSLQRAISARQMCERPIKASVSYTSKPHFFCRESAQRCRRDHNGAPQTALCPSRDRKSRGDLAVSADQNISLTCRAAPEKLPPPTRAPFLTCISPLAN